MATRDSGEGGALRGYVALTARGIGWLTVRVEVRDASIVAVGEGRPKGRAGLLVDARSAAGDGEWAEGSERR